jgi:protein-tyrosine phosphatase
MPPIPDSYWIVPGKLLAGEYPGAKLEADAIPRLAAFAAAGVTSFIDVTEEREGLTPYAHLLPPGARWTRLAIRDGGCPAPAEMRIILDRIDDELAGGAVVYLHCWGGHGRTGTVAGCWLVRHGTRPEAALARIDELRREVPDASWMPSPETREQRKLVLEWIVHDPMPP